MSDIPIRRETICIVTLAATLLAGCAIADSKPSSRELFVGCGEGQQVHFHCAVGADSYVSLCGAPGGQVIYRETASAAKRVLTIRDGADASFHYNRFTRPRATHEEVGFDFQGQRYTIFSYDDADLGKPQVGRSIGARNGESTNHVDNCTGVVTSRLAPLEDTLPCDPESALGCP